MNVPGWIKTHRIAAVCAAGALVLVIGGGVTWGVLASAQSPEVAVTVPSESPKPTSKPKPSATSTPKPTATTKPSTTTPTTPEEKPEQPRTDEPKTQNPGTDSKQPPAPQPPAPQPPPAPEPPPPPPPEPEPETPRGDANAELASRYGTNFNGVTRCGNANSGSATSAASLPPWAGVGNVGWSVWAEDDRWHVQYMSCE